MQTRTLALAVLAAAAPALLWSQASPQPSPPPGHEHHRGGVGPAAKAGPAAKPEMMAHCKEMMGRHQQMMEEMKAADTRLDALVTRLNGASGDDARLDALTAVVTEMVAQRRQMHERMASMPQMMMGHAMQHAAGGGAMDCPMMKGMAPATNR